ncbi:hypothetical protein TFLX_06433 [Thermoflexales bacterium]|nr:hypothetical protein TFLX_06433 [Thermoflexales bacterium]
MSFDFLRHRSSWRRPSSFRARLCIILALLAAGWLWPVSSYAQRASNTWSQPVDATLNSTAQMGSFNLLLCDPYQNAYLLWAEQAANGAAVYLRTDATGSWSTARDIIAVPGAVVFNLAAAISQPEDTLHLIWVDQHLRGNLYYSQAPLHTAEQPSSWSTPQLLGQAVDWSSIKADSTGTAHVVYGTTDDSGLEHTVYHLELPNSGANWSDQNVAYSVVSALPALIRPELAIDGRDRLHIGLSLNSYEYGAYSEVGYIHSEDNGQTWGAYRQVQNTGSTFQGVAWIAPYAFGTDEVHLTWHDPRRMHSWSSDGGQTWREPKEIMPLAAAFGGRNELTRDSAGVLHVVTAVGDGVYSASWNGAEWSAPEQIDSRFIDPHGQTIVTCQGNQLHVAYYDRTGENKVWYTTRLVNAPPLERKAMPLSSTTSDLARSTPTITAAIILTPVPAGRPAVNPVPPDTPNPMRAILLPFLAALALIAGVVTLHLWREAH